MKKLPLDVRAFAFVESMLCNPPATKFNISDIAIRQGISKPMARRVFMRLAIMGYLVIELYPYRSNTGEIRFSLLQNAQFNGPFLRECSHKVLINRLDKQLAELKELEGLK